MWISGSINTFSHNLHQIPSGGTEDLITGAYPEGQNYTGVASLNLRNQWNKEFNLQYYRFTNDGTMLATGNWFI